MATQSIKSVVRGLTPPLLMDFIRRMKPNVQAANPSDQKVDLELARLCLLPQMQRATTTIFGWPFEVYDGNLFVGLYETFFTKQIYQFETNEKKPLIIDCGANIGVSVVWWKTTYPNSRVVAFEPDPEIFEVLKGNCGHLPDVTLINAAVWNKDGEISFLAKGGLSGNLAEFSKDASGEVSVSVAAKRLRTYLEARCDFLKIDIEGAEVEVIQDCADLLKNVSRAFIEYHSFVGRPQLLGQTISILERAGFRLHIHTEMPSPKPFNELIIVNEKDVRLDLFCYRDDTQPLLTVKPWRNL